MYTSNRRKKTSGFTLVEVLMVVLIISVLAGLVLGVARFANEKAAVSQAETDLQQLAMLIEEYKNEKGVYPGTFANWTDVNATSFTGPLAGEYYDRLVEIGFYDPWRGAYQVKIPDAQGYLCRIRSLGEDRLGSDTATDATNDDNLEVQ